MMLPDRVSVFTGDDSDLRAVHKAIEKNAARSSGRNAPNKKYGSKRARMAYAWREKVSPRHIFARDEWICQLCGTPTLRPGERGDEDLSPTVDHIVPLSLGGAHAMWNTQCVHRCCNAAKGNDAAQVDLLQLLRIVGSHYGSTKRITGVMQRSRDVTAPRKVKRKNATYCLIESDGRCKGSCRIIADCSGYAEAAQASNESWWGARAEKRVHK